MPDGPVKPGHDDFFGGGEARDAALGSPAGLTGGSGPRGGPMGPRFRGDERMRGATGGDFRRSSPRKRGPIAAWRARQIDPHVTWGRADGRVRPLAELSMGPVSRAGQMARSSRA